MISKRGIVVALWLTLAVPPPANAADAQGDNTQGSAPEMTSEQTGADDAETQSAMAFLSALGQLDFERAGALLDDNVVLDLPFAGAGHVVTGRSQVVDFFRNTMSGKVARIAYQLDDAYPRRAPGATVLEVSTKVEGAHGGTTSNRFVAVFRFKHGKIVLFREYFNPAPIVALQ